MSEKSEIQNPKSKMVERDGAVLWHPYTQHAVAPSPIAIKSAKGVWLETVDGERILDGISSWWVNIHGHSNDYLNAALARQAETLEQVIFAGFTHEPAILLAEKLLAILPQGLTRVFYSDNGSTAVEVALKMAWQFWQNRGESRTTFVALENAYHGDTFGAMAASAHSSFTAPFQPLLFNIKRAGAPDSPEFLPHFERLLDESQDQIAAVIIEPMLQGAGGMKIYPAEVLQKIRAVCDEKNVLLIADEVLTGFGRTGKMFACEHAGIAPDIICLSKALTAGYLPLGVTAATERIYEAFLSQDRAKTFFHGHSFTANPLACAVATASLELFKSEKLLEKIAVINRKFNEAAPVFGALKIVSEVRVIGAILIIELRDEGGYLAGIGQKLFPEFIKRGILLRPLGNVLYFMPPYVITESEIDFVVEAIESVLNACADNLHNNESGIKSHQHT